MPKPTQCDLKLSYNESSFLLLILAVLLSSKTLGELLFKPSVPPADSVLPPLSLPQASTKHY